MSRSLATVALAAAEFGPFDGRSWFNTAHQGPLPRAAVDATAQAAALKAAPHRIGDDDFRDVPERLRALLARLVGGRSEEIVLGNSTSHGLHLIAHGLSWQDGDEILTVEGDYPATVLPWQRLAGAGVRTRSLRPTSDLLSGEELAAAIGPRTRVLAVTWVDSFHRPHPGSAGVGCGVPPRRDVAGRQRVASARCPPDRRDGHLGRRGRVLRVQVALRAVRHRLQLAAPGSTRPASAAAGVLAGHASRPRAGPDA